MAVSQVLPNRCYVGVGVQLLFISLVVVHSGRLAASDPVFRLCNALFSLPL